MTLTTSIRGHDTARFAPLPRPGVVSRVRSLIRSALLLSRDTLPPGQYPQPPVGFQYGIVRSASNPLFAPLAALAAENRLDRAWCIQQLNRGAAACVALLEHTSQAVAMGWVTPRQTHVSEIQCTFDPLAGGCYLYCGYVSPNFRGRRIHRLLDAARLAYATTAFDASIGYTLVVPTNISSLRGHATAGFALAARINILDAGPVVLALMRRSDSRSPLGAFHYENTMLRSGLNLIRPRQDSQNKERASDPLRRPPLN